MVTPRKCARDRAALMVRALTISDHTRGEDFGTKGDRGLTATRVPRVALGRGPGSDRASERKSLRAREIAPRVESCDPIEQAPEATSLARLARCRESGQAAGHRAAGPAPAVRDQWRRWPAGLEAGIAAGSGWDPSRRWSPSWCGSLPARSGDGSVPVAADSRPPASVRSPGYPGTVYPRAPRPP